MNIFNQFSFMMPTQAASAVVLDGSIIIIIGFIALAYLLYKHRKELFDCDEESYKNMLATGVDGVMIGRGAQGKPWIFNELKGKPFNGNKFEVIKRHVEILRSQYDENWLNLYMRKHFLWYASGFDGASKIRLSLATSPSIDDSLKILKELMSN